jgi:RsiW-degrading membrane proteinase PrsW (M82 family)
MAEFKFNCPHCNQPLEAPEDMRGQMIECPSCKKAFQLPDSAGAESASTEATKKKCPFCGENILAEAKKCKHCGEFLDEQLRKQAEAQANRTSYNPIHQIQAFIRWFTGLDRLNGFRVGQLFSGVFKRRSGAEVEAYFQCGGPHATPQLNDVPVEWPRPWFFWRLLVFGLLVFIGFQFGLEHFENPKLLPGLIIVGAFFVPVSCGVLFFEYNVLRNISLYQALKYTVAGGILSLIAALFLFQFSGLNETFLGATSAGIVEETAKLLTAIVLARGLTGNRWILNGMFIGAAVGVGFAGFETAGYIFEALVDDYSSMHGTLIMRALFAPFGHVVWTAATAGALWRVKQERPFSVGMLFDGKFLRVFAFVVLLHMFWNSGMLWTMRGYSLIYGWMVSLLGSWYLALLLLQQGLNQVRNAKLTADE